MMTYQEQYQKYLDWVERTLPGMLPERPAEEGGQSDEAARYSLMAGGKRLRPVLLMAVSDMLGVELSKALPFACALEMIHTYSLIHDDLPCMDNDDLRRGRPTCHKVFGEAMAVLAGDLLLNRACEILLDAVDPACPGTLAAARDICRAAGGQGMIGGQTLDLAAEGRCLSAGELKQMHRQKTGALLLAPILAAADLAEAAPDVVHLLHEYGQSAGLAFQIQDDILDAVADARTLGKTAGKDSRDNKATYVSIYGLAEARRHLVSTLSKARQAVADLAPYGLETGFLTGFIDFLQTRNH